MRIEKIDTLMKQFKDNLSQIEGLAPICFEISEPLSVANIYSEEEKSKLKGKDAGVYIFHRKESGEIFYIGISTNILSRFSQHIGKNFQWKRDGHEAYFPNATLVHGKPWIEDKCPGVRDAVINADFLLTAITVNQDNYDMASFIESFLIYTIRKNGNGLVNSAY